jgi:SsrA-binding protein
MTDSERKIKVMTTNRKAFHEFEIMERIEAGMSLVGSEVKSMRIGKIQMADSYATIIDGEVFLINLHISQYKMATIESHDPIRKRRLLLNKKEIKRLWKATNEKGYTIVPLKIYFKGPYAKVELGVARGKKQYDKRQAIAKREADRDMARKMKEHNK